jgi:hypothetical protein
MVEMEIKFKRVCNSVVITRVFFVIYWDVENKKMDWLEFCLKNPQKNEEKSKISSNKTNEENPQRKSAQISDIK